MIHYGHWGEERQRNQRENAVTRTGKMEKTNAIKVKQRNTAIHLLTHGSEMNLFYCAGSFSIKASKIYTSFFSPNEDVIYTNLWTPGRKLV